MGCDEEVLQWLLCNEQKNDFEEFPELEQHLMCYHAETGHDVGLSIELGLI